MKIPTLYMAGPMAKIAEWNFPAFLDVDTALIGIGYKTINPAKLDLLDGFSPWGMSGYEVRPEGMSRRQVLKKDFIAICDSADGIAVLPGWEKSSGARAEVAVGEAIGITAKPWDWWYLNFETVKEGRIG